MEYGKTKLVTSLATGFYAVFAAHLVHSLGHYVYLTFISQAVSRGIGLSFVPLYFWFIFFPTCLALPFLTQYPRTRICLMLFPMLLLSLWCITYYPKRVALLLLSTLSAYSVIFLIERIGLIAMVSKKRITFIPFLLMATILSIYYSLEFIQKIPIFFH